MAETVKLKPAGLNLDQPAHLLGENLWSGGDNIFFKDNKTTKRGGFENLDPGPLATPHQIIYTKLGDVSYWVYVNGTGGVYVYDGATHYNITPTAWEATDGYISLFLLNNIPIINNPISGPYYWPGGPPALCLPLPGWDDIAGSSTTTCTAMFANLYHIFAVGVKEGNQDFGTGRVRWSDAAPPGTIPGVWIPEASNQAGFVDLPTPQGALIGGHSLRDTAVIFKGDSTFTARYVGGTAIYAFETIFQNTGLRAPGAVVESDGTLIFLSQESVIRTDGNTVEDIADGVLKAQFIDQINMQYVQRAFIELDKTTNQIFVAVPTPNSAGACDKILVYNQAEKHWSLFTLLPASEVYCAGSGPIDAQLDDTWESIKTTWAGTVGSWTRSITAGYSELLAMGTTGNISVFTGSSTDNEVAIPASIEKLGMTLGAVDRKKRVTRVWPMFERGEGSVQISVGYSEFSNLQPTWEGPYTFTINQDRSIPVNVLGRAFHIKMEETGTAEQWELTGMNFEVTDAGRF